MGIKVDLDLSFDGLIKHAVNALESGDQRSCALNLNEALLNAESREQKHTVYELFVECFSTSSNIASIMCAIAKEIETSVEDEYYRFDFTVQKKDCGKCDDSETSDNYYFMRDGNKVKNLILERKYDDAMALLMRGQPQVDRCEEIMQALLSAVENDPDFNVGKYSLQIFGLMLITGARVEGIRLLLAGGEFSHRMAIESANGLLDEEDSNFLCLMGVAFFENNELAIAKKFFEKTLSIDPIDEDALYYMSVINILKPDNSKHDDYWSIYKQVYKITDPPIAMTEEFFRSEHVHYLAPYRSLPSQFLQTDMALLVLEADPKEDINEETAEKLYDFCKVAPTEAGRAVIEQYGSCKNKPVLIETYLKMLSSSRISDGLKKKVYAELIDGGYEGALLILTDEKVVCLRVAKLHKRVNKTWGNAYKFFLKIAPFLNEYLPIKCGELAKILKKLDEIISPEEEDMEFCLALLIANYLKQIKINVDYFDMLKAFEINLRRLEKFFKKFKMESIFIE